MNDELNEALRRLAEKTEGKRQEEKSAKEEEERKKFPWRWPAKVYNMNLRLYDPILKDIWVFLEVRHIKTNITDEIVKNPELYADLQYRAVIIENSGEKHVINIEPYVNKNRGSFDMKVKYRDEEIVIDLESGDASSEFRRVMAHFINEITGNI